MTMGTELGKSGTGRSHEKKRHEIFIYHLVMTNIAMENPS